MTVHLWTCIASICTKTWYRHVSSSLTAKRKNPHHRQGKIIIIFIDSRKARSSRNELFLMTLITSTFSSTMMMMMTPLPWKLYSLTFFSRWTTQANDATACRQVKRIWAFLLSLFCSFSPPSFSCLRVLRNERVLILLYLYILSGPIPSCECNILNIFILTLTYNIHLLHLLLSHINFSSDHPLLPRLDFACRKYLFGAKLIREREKLWVSESEQGRKK